MIKIMRKIQKIIDGDTFTVRKSVNGSQYIRIANLDAPEKGERGYSAAKNKLARLKGKIVTLEPVGRSRGRIVAKVFYKKRQISD